MPHSFVADWNVAFVGMCTSYRTRSLAEGLLMLVESDKQKDVNVLCCLLRAMSFSFVVIFLLKDTRIETRTDQSRYHAASICGHLVHTSGHF